MKFLTIVRHAKAKSPQNYSSDFERPLASKGRKQCKRLAPLITSLDTKVDWMLASPALRTKETAKRLAKRIDFTQDIAYDAAIYAASSETLLDVLKAQPKSADHILLVGHNPGMESLTSGLASGDTMRLGLGMSTGTLAHLELDLAHWRQIRWGCGVIRLICPPKFLPK